MSKTDTPRGVRNWTEQEKQALKSVLGLTDGELEQLLVWVTDTRRDSKTVDDPLPELNPTRWSS